MERAARSTVVCIQMTPDPVVSTLDCSRFKVVRARVVFLLYGDIHIHGCMLPPRTVRSGCALWIIALIAVFLEHQCCLLVVMELLASA